MGPSRPRHQDACLCRQMGPTATHLEFTDLSLDREIQCSLLDQEQATSGAASIVEYYQ